MVTPFCVLAASFSLVFLPATAVQGKHQNQCDLCLHMTLLYTSWGCSAADPSSLDLSFLVCKIG